MEQAEQSPCVEFQDSTIQELHGMYSEKTIICRFNGLWPKTKLLYQWIHNNWTKDCDISLCSKGFFIVLFDNLADYKKVLENGPWFWGKAGCFITAWTENFDPAHASVTITPVWVRLLNLPIHFCSIVALTEIENSLGKLVAIDWDRFKKGLVTYV